jgi:ABC-type dipeptide/oligopeptide/nickel transport system permease component
VGEHASNRFITGVSLIGVCTPIFLVAIFGMYVLGPFRLRALPMSGVGSWKSYFLPS